MLCRLCQPQRGCSEGAAPSKFQVKIKVVERLNSASLLKRSAQGSMERETGGKWVKKIKETQKEFSCFSEDSLKLWAGEVLMSSEAQRLVGKGRSSNKLQVSGEKPRACQYLPDLFMWLLLNLS